MTRFYSQRVFNVKCEMLSVAQLFSGPRRYVVPLFQRRYVWHKDKQLARLWTDIVVRADARLGRGARRKALSTTHLLGTLVLAPGDGGSADTGFEVVDGQQRLTTLQLVLAAIRDRALAMGAASTAALASRHLGMTGAGTATQPRLVINRADATAFFTVLHQGSADAVRALCGGDGSGAPSRLLRAYLYFAGEVERYLPDGADVAKAEALLAAATEALWVAAIEIDHDDDAQQTYESLNNLGEVLTAGDLIRNLLFAQAARQGRSPVELYERYWAQFDLEELLPAPSTGGAEGSADAEDAAQSATDEEDAAGGELAPEEPTFKRLFWDERAGRERRPRLDWLLQSYLSTREGVTVVRQSELFGEFRNWLLDGRRPVEEVLQHIALHGEQYLRLHRTDSSDRMCQLVRRLGLLRIQSLDPLLVVMLERELELGIAGELDPAVAALDSYVVRRQVVGLDSSSFSDIFLRLARQVSRLGSAGAIVAAVRGALKSRGNGSHWPSDDELSAAWLNRPVYRDRNSGRAFGILMGLESEMSGRARPPSAWEGYNIEHLLPVGWSEERYPLPVPDTRAARKRRGQLVETIGNLTLLPIELNREIENREFAYKQSRIAGRTDLALNAFLTGRKSQSWSESDIEERGRGLLTPAKRVWPAPDAK